MTRANKPFSNRLRIVTAVILLIPVVSALSVNQIKQIHRERNRELIKAVLAYNYQAAKKALDEGADANAKDSRGADALLIAAANTWDPPQDLIRLLVEHGANVNTTGGNTALVDAVSKRDLASVNLLLNHGADPNLFALNSGEPLLYVAIDSQSIDIVKAVLDHGARINVTLYGDSPLGRAILATNSSDIVKLLIDRRADVNYPAENDWPPIIVACRNRNYNTLKLLVEHGANVNAKGPDGTTPLIADSLIDYYHPNDSIECIKYLLQKGANPSIADVNGYTPIEAACSSWSPESDEAARLLLARLPRHPKNNSLDRALITGVAHLRINTIALLIEHGANVNAVSDDGTPLINAASKPDLGQIVSPNAADRPDLVRLLLRKGAKVDGRGSDGSTALMDASLECMRLLIAAGANVNAFDDNGFTPLLYAADDKSPDAIRLLLSHGARFRLGDGHADTPLMEAASQGNVACVNELIRAGCPVNWPDGSGETALFYAVSYPRFMTLVNDINALKTATFLIDHGADVNLKDKAGKTALSLANQDNMRDLLIAHGAKQADKK